MRIAITSDVHIGRKDALVEEFFEASISINKLSDIIIVAGDVVDNDHPATRESFAKYLELAEEYDFFEKLFFIYGGMKHEVKILHSFPSLLVNDFCLLSTKLGRIIVLHGNNIGLYYNSDEGEHAKFGAERAKLQLITKPVSWLPKINKEDYLIFGHLHKRFYHEPMKIYCVGCWLPTKDSMNDTGYFLLIDDQKENSFSAIRFNTIKK